MAKRGHSAARTCVGCRQEAGKRALVRLVRDPEAATVRIDATGRASGRGAYLHPDPACIELARRRGALARALKGSVADEVWTALTAAAEVIAVPG